MGAVVVTTTDSGHTGPGNTGDPITKHGNLRQMAAAGCGGPQMVCVGNGRGLGAIIGKMGMDSPKQKQCKGKTVETERKTHQYRASV